MPLTQQLLLLDGWKFWGITSLSAVAAICGFYFAFHFLRRARIIEDTPTANIRSAHQGYVELAGTAAQMDGEPILAPLTHLPCCWYSYKVERLDDKRWLLADQGTSDDLFLLQDKTGKCIIHDPLPQSFLSSLMLSGGQLCEVQYCRAVWRRRESGGSSQCCAPVVVRVPPRLV